MGGGGGGYLAFHLNGKMKCLQGLKALMSSYCDVACVLCPEFWLLTSV